MIQLLVKPRNRNKPCVCKSGKKLKHCCLGKVKALQLKIKGEKNEQ
nr:SEC-C metal-binding domain-containing protein [Vibrio sp. S17_S38]